MVPVGRESRSSDYEWQALEADKAIRDRCASLGLSLAHAQRLAAENYRTD